MNREIAISHYPQHQASKTGYVYVLTNPAMPGLCKIGYTSRNPEERARELFKGVTGIPQEFTVAYSRQTPHFKEVEREAHKQLGKGRNKQYREFFRVTPGDAGMVIDTIANWYESKHPRTESKAIVVECLICKSPNRYRIDTANGRRAKCGRCGAWLIFESR